jgi:hypothetical protein
MAATGLLIGGGVSDHQGTEQETCRRWYLELTVTRTSRGVAARDACRYLEAACELAQQHDVGLSYALIPRDREQRRGGRR